LIADVFKFAEPGSSPAWSPEEHCHLLWTEPRVMVRAARSGRHRPGGTVPIPVSLRMHTVDKRRPLPPRRGLNRSGKSDARLHASILFWQKSTLIAVHQSVRGARPAVSKALPVLDRLLRIVLVFRFQAHVVRPEFRLAPTASAGASTLRTGAVVGSFHQLLSCAGRDSTIPAVRQIPI